MVLDVLAISRLHGAKVASTATNSELKVQGSDHFAVKRTCFQHRAYRIFE